MTLQGSIWPKKSKFTMFDIDINHLKYKFDFTFAILIHILFAQ